MIAPSLTWLLVAIKGTLSPSCFGRLVSGARRRQRVAVAGQKEEKEADYLTGADVPAFHFTDDQRRRCPV